MSDEIDLRQFGGVRGVQAGGDPRDPAAAVWNFGIMGMPGIDGPSVAGAAPDLYDVAPNVRGRWDGKTTICAHDAARKVLGKTLPAQMQPRGTCGGRTAKRALDHLQTVLIGAGRRAKFRASSHAWPYFLARREGGMLGSGDGVPGGYIPPVMAKYGNLFAEEAGDTGDYGPGSDDLAVRWGGRSGAPAEMFAKAEDNKVGADLVRVRTFQEMADGFAAGGVGLVSSLRGFTMQRDANGMCRPQGQWAHYMAVSGVGVLKSGQAFAAIDQSWGSNTPSGPLLEDGRFPDYTFGADRDTVERDMIRGGELHMIFGFQLWDESQLIDWRDVV